MPANGMIASSSFLDTTATFMRPLFASLTSDGTNEYTGGPHWQCTQCRIAVGPSPSSAIVRIPLAATQDETSPSVAAVNSNLNEIKIGTQCVIDGMVSSSASSSVPLLVGRVVDINNDIDTDEKVIEILDDRYLLEAFQIVGQFHINGTSGDSVIYRQGWPAVFNAGGMPNGVYVNIGGTTTSMIKVFCPPNWNLADGETPPTPNDFTDGSDTKASYWSLEDMLIYAQYISSALVSSKVALFRWYPTLPDSIVWPQSYFSAVLGGDLDKGSAADNTNTAKTAAARKGREINAEGMPILSFVTEVLHAAGPYEIMMTPKKDKGASTYKSVVQVVRTKYAGGGVSISRPTSEASLSFTGQSIITGGNFRLSGRALYTKVALGGGLVYIERRCNSERTTNIGTNGLLKAWSQTLQDAFKTDVQAILQASLPTTQSTLEIVLTKILSEPKYSKLFQAYRLAPEWDFKAGTDQSALPLCVLGRPILPHLLSNFLESGASTASASNPYEKLSAYCEVRPEVNSTNDFSTDGQLPDKNDGLAIDADGTIWLPGLRSTKQTFSASVNTTTGVVTLTARAVRMTVAIPCDHRLNTAFKIGTDKTPGLFGFTPDPGADDSDLIDETLSRLYFADARQLYTKHLRIGTGSAQTSREFSYPWPGSAGGTAASDKSGTTSLRDDTTYADAHCRKRLSDLSRVQRTGRLIIPHLAFAWQPGMGIKDLQPSSGQAFPIRGQVNAVIFHADENTNITELELG